MAAKESLLQPEKLEAYLMSRRDYSASIICKVPPSLRGDNVDAYEPHIAGLGPYHHDNDTLLLQQELKMECVIRSLQRMGRLDLHSLEENVALMRNEVETHRHQIGSCYQDDFEFDADKLILDSCFVIEVCMVKAHKADPILGRLNVRNAFTHSVICDIFKLENQLPLFLIKLFMHLQNIEYRILIGILRWAFRRVFFISDSDKKLLEKKSLEMLTQSTNPPVHLLECLQRLIIWCIRENYIYPSKLQKLQTTLQTVLRNVMAYEECFCVPDNKVSRFVFLIGCLIDMEEDVALLRKVELIDNSMDSDQAVAHMFNSLTNHITTSYFGAKDDRIWEKLHEYHASSWRVMLKEFIDSHFSKPGILCATVAAVVLLILSVVQTYYTIKPAK